MMRVLVVGCGSIGKKHITNLLKMEKIEHILVCTKNEDCLKEFDNSGKVEVIEQLVDLSSSSCQPFDFAIIANETYKHIDTAIFLAQKGINLFIEKPLSHNLKHIDLLREIAQQKNLKTFIAYNLRFLGALQYLKEKLQQGIVGDVYFAKIEVGQYLPSWRPDTDYRTSYSASSAKGGGVALDLSHEIDYMQFLFGAPYDWKVIKSKVSNLEIDSEDMFEGIYKYNNGFICNVHLDYLQPSKKREIRIEGNLGTVFVDLIGKYIKITGTNKKELLITNEELFDVRQTYVAELNHFISCIEEKQAPDITLDNGINTLKLLEDRNV